MEIIVAILVIAAIVCFVLDALGIVAVRGWNLIGFGLALVTIALLLSNSVFAFKVG